MHKGEVWLINLDPAVETEIQNTRPVIIVNENSLGVLPLRVIVSLTDWKERFEVAPWMIRISPNDSNGLNKPSAADAFQIRSISQERFIRHVGVASSEQLGEILKAVCRVLGVDFSSGFHNFH